MVKMFPSLILCLFQILLSVAALEAQKPEPVDLAFICTNKDSDNPILLFHGALALKEFWFNITVDGNASVAEELAEGTGRKVCAPDLRNFGESPSSPETSMDAMAVDILKLIETLNAEKAILLGHSFGGKLAAHIALNYPEKVEKVIVEDIRPNDVPHKVTGYIQPLLSIMLTALEAVPEGVGDKAAEKAIRESLTKQVEKLNIPVVIGGNYKEIIPKLPLTCSEGNCRFQIHLPLLKSIVNDLSSVLVESSGVYKKPALFIYGTASPSKVGTYKEEIRELFPEVKFVALQGVGHEVERTKEALTAAVEFITA